MSLSHWIQEAAEESERQGFVLLGLDHHWTQMVANAPVSAFNHTALPNPSLKFDFPLHMNPQAYVVYFALVSCHAKRGCKD